MRYQHQLSTWFRDAKSEPADTAGHVVRAPVLLSGGHFGLQGIREVDFGTAWASRRPASAVADLLGSWLY
jgi:hypothetical protein